jgi:hypothetical protein
LRTVADAILSIELPSLDLCLHLSCISKLSYMLGVNDVF